MTLTRSLTFITCTALAGLLLLSSPWEGEARRRALTTIPGGFHLPNEYKAEIEFVGMNTENLLLQNTSFQKVAWLVRAPATGTLDGVGTLLASVSSPSDIKFSFQDVDADMNPDGTADQFRVIASGSVVNGWAETGIMSDDGTDGGARRSVTQGDLFAVVVEWDSTQSGTVWFSGLTANQADHAFPYAMRSADGTTWTRNMDVSLWPNIALRYDGDVFHPLDGVYPVSAAATVDFNSSSSPDERALIFTPPVDIGVSGFWVLVSTANDFDVVLYDTDGSTPLATASIDEDAQRNPGTQGNLHIYFDSVVALTGSSTYRLSFKPTTTSNIRLWQMTTGSAAVMGALPGGASFHLSTREDAGSWTETTTIRLFAGLTVAQIESGGGGGGGGAFSVPFIGGLRDLPLFGVRLRPQDRH